MICIYQISFYKHEIKYDDDSVFLLYRYIDVKIFLLHRTVVMVFQLELILNLCV